MFTSLEFGRLQRLSRQHPLTRGECEAHAQTFADKVSAADAISWNYVIPDGTVVAAHIAEVPPPPPFDFIANIWHANATFSTSTREAATRSYQTERFSTPAAELGKGVENPADAPIKQFCLIRRREGLSFHEFIEYYETLHAPLAAKYLRSIASYSRNYIVLDESRPANIDAVIEICFRNMGDHRDFREAFDEPRLGALFAQDEGRLLDRRNIVMFLASEHWVQPRKTPMPVKG